ncbi:MAG: DUF6379 domain-containing protein [Actinomycetaceae bacterium]|nr:DUF6379 domain-containing protein [Actinomycetaceae bacterium]
MFNELIIKEGSVRQIIDEGGEPSGFLFDTYIAYYRGLGLSMVETPEIYVDGELISAKRLRFRYAGITRTFAELADVTDVRWELGTPAQILVDLPGGLSTGDHEISVNQRLRVSYLPIMSENRFTRQVTID